MKNKKIVTLLATLGLITCLYTKVDAVKFYDTVGTRYEGAVEKLGDLEIISGVADKTFNPNKTVTRAEFAKMIVEATLTQDDFNALIIDDANCNFTDVSKNAWYYEYVVVATNYGYFKGYEDNTFKPDKEVTYEEASKIFMKALGHGYLVETDPRGWAAEYLDKMYALKINEGTYKFEENEPATRGNIAIMLWNSLTNNVWKKILLNDVAGFTYIDSGTTLFEKKIKGYTIKKNVKINGFKEIDDSVYVNLSGTYYRLFDQDTTVLFSMIGGKADVLLKKVRYPKDVYEYEVVGLSTDMGSTLYSGTLDELRKEGLTSDASTVKVGVNTDYGYLVDNEAEKADRLVAVSSREESFYINKIKVDVKKEKAEKDDKEVIAQIKAENSPDYIYKENYESAVKTITLNEEYEIKDGAILFQNNKRVNWNTVKSGAVITEAKKDEYYFVSTETVTTKIKDYTIKDKEVEFSTTNGLMVAYNNAKCIEYYSKNNETKNLNKIGEEKLKTFVGKEVRFTLDFTARATRIEILEADTEDIEQGETNTENLLDLGVAFYSNMSYGPDDKNNRITLFYNNKKKSYRTTLKDAKANLGDIVTVKFENSNVITEIKTVSNSAKISDKFNLKKISSEEFDKNQKEGKVAKNIPIYHAKYYYDFGEYDKVVDFKLQAVTIDILDEIDTKKVEYYALTDNDGLIRNLILADYTDKKDIFYGKVEKIYVTDKSKIMAQISVIGYKKVEYEISGLANCEEGDIISFKIVKDKIIDPLEKYTANALGYYKDIVVTDIQSKNKIISENGTIDLDEGIISVGDKEYKLSKYNIFLLNVKKDLNDDTWLLGKCTVCEPKTLKLEKGDRIAINEIEDTVIIYRGYKE